MSMCRPHAPTPLLAAMLFGLLLLTTGPMAQASTPSPSELAPSQDTTTVLTLHDGAQRQNVSRADIETLPLYEVTLNHFEGIKGRFTGVWLDDFLAEYGLDEPTPLRFIAHDDYTTFLSREDRREKRFLLATRLDGEPLTLSEFGPTLLIVPEDAAAVEAGTASMTHWVWSIRDIIAP
ncbi:molybdopterin-dependent oxidoreductase [Halomonas mongoliensis]|nr:molybdopterin-dependent oxidoreductase [Halomonas mongoliensis]